MALAQTLVLGLHADPSLDPRQDEQGFDQGLREVYEQIAESSYGAAERDLLALLEEHRERDYVWLQRARVVEALRLCAFLPDYEPPRPEQLVSGELHKYSPSTGQLRISYQDGDVRDFLVLRSDGTLVPRDGAKLGDGDFLLHPAEFDRGYTLEIRGRQPKRTAGPPSILFVFSAWEQYVLSFGLLSGMREEPASWTPWRIPKVVLERERSPVRLGAPFEIEVRVRANEVQALWNGESIFRVKKDRKAFGRFGLAGLPEWEELEITGVARRSWMRGLQDEAFQRDREAFDESFDDEAALPEWLRFERIGRDEYLADSLPLGTPEELEGHVRELFALVEADSIEEAKEHARGLDFKDVGVAFDLYSRLLYDYAVEDYHGSIKGCELLLEQDPDFLPVRYLRGWMEGLYRPWKGVLLLGELAEEYPEDGRFPGAQAVLRLLEGKRGESEAIVRTALEAGLYGDELDQAADLLSKAEAGPFWLERFTHETEHFRIASDIDLRTCREAGDILETALRYYERRYVPIPKEKTERFPVFVFSGETGYQDYLVDISFFPAENTAGVYLPSLKQLLIWNTPNREDMLNTVRHEGLHQYMDYVLGDHPRWMAEGLGEYWEAADFTKGRSKQNAPTPEKILATKSMRTRFTPLERFLRMDAREFMARPSIHYTQAWAFMHFLHHGGDEFEALFDGMMEELLQGGAPLDAVELVFGELDLAALETSFMEYCLSLR